MKKPHTRYYIQTTLVVLNTIGFVVVAIPVLWGLLCHPGALLPFLMGGMSGIWWQWGRPRSVWSVLLHEVGHGLFSEISGDPVHKIMARASVPNAEDQRLGFCQSGGTASGVFRHCWILAPYFFPLSTALLLLIRLTLGESVPPLFDAMLGFSLGAHLVSHSSQTWAGIRRAKNNSLGGHVFSWFGTPFSVAFISMAHLMIVPSILLIVHSGWREAGRYFLAGQGFWWNFILM